MRTATALLLDDGDTHTCPQTISFSVCCKWFRWAVLPLDGTLEAEIFRDKELETLCGLRRRVRPKVQPGEILSRLRRQSSQAAENRK